MLRGQGIQRDINMKRVNAPAKYWSLVAEYIFTNAPEIMAMALLDYIANNTQKRLANERRQGLRQWPRYQPGVLDRAGAGSRAGCTLFSDMVKL